MTRADHFPYSLSAAELAALPPLPDLSPEQFALLYLLAEHGPRSWVPEGLIPFLSERAARRSGKETSLVFYKDYRQGLRLVEGMVDEGVLDHEAHYGTYSVTTRGIQAAEDWAKHRPDCDTVEAASETACGFLGNSEDLDYMTSYLVPRGGFQRESAASS
jgi:hypothetical protein